MLKEEDQFISIDVGIIVRVEVAEGLSHSVPLLSYLIDKFIEHIFVLDDGQGGHLFISTLSNFLLLHVLFLRWVLLRVVAEDETCQVMNFVAHPTREVSVGEPSRPIFSTIRELHHLHKVAIFYRDVGTVYGHDVFWLDKSIMVLINRQECLIDRCKVTRNLGADLFV